MDSPHQPADAEQTILALDVAAPAAPALDSDQNSLASSHLSDIDAPAALKDSKLSLNNSSSNSIPIPKNEQELETLNSRIEEVSSQVRSLEDQLDHLPESKHGIHRSVSAPVLTANIPTSPSQVNVTDVMHPALRHSPSTISQLSQASILTSQQLRIMVLRHKLLNEVTPDHLSSLLASKKTLLRRLSRASLKAQTQLNYKKRSSRQFSSSPKKTSGLPPYLAGRLKEIELEEATLQGKKYFNVAHDYGLKYLIDNGVIDNPEKKPDHVSDWEQWKLHCADQVAKFLLNQTEKGGLSKNMVGKFLGSGSPFSRLTLSRYAQQFDFRHLTLDASLRVFMLNFNLPADTDRIYRITESFASQWWNQNKTNVDLHRLQGAFWNQEAIHILTLAIIQLNNDMYHSKVRKARKRDFVKTTVHGLHEVMAKRNIAIEESLNSKKNIDMFLKLIYVDIRERPLQPLDAGDEFFDLYKYFQHHEKELKLKRENFEQSKQQWTGGRIDESAEEDEDVDSFDRASNELSDGEIHGEKTVDLKIGSKFMKSMERFDEKDIDLEVTPKDMEIDDATRSTHSATAADVSADQHSIEPSQETSTAPMEVDVNNQSEGIVSESTAELAATENTAKTSFSVRNPVLSPSMATSPSQSTLVSPPPPISLSRTMSKHTSEMDSFQKPGAGEKIKNLRKGLKSVFTKVKIAANWKRTQNHSNSP
ncbi:Sec7 domain-containing protein [Paraphysoderma sedebokerense]|nr:Sec7 domain-containing protein [Paraphysoderma sedebokerense]